MVRGEYTNSIRLGEDASDETGHEGVTIILRLLFSVLPPRLLLVFLRQL